MPHEAPTGTSSFDVASDACRKWLTHPASASKASGGRPLVICPVCYHPSPGRPLVSYGIRSNRTPFSAIGATYTSLGWRSAATEPQVKSPRHSRKTGAGEMPHFPWQASARFGLFRVSSTLRAVPALRAMPASPTERPATFPPLHRPGVRRAAAPIILNLGFRFAPPQAGIDRTVGAKKGESKRSHPPAPDTLFFRLFTCYFSLPTLHSAFLP
jgi:hypothetical protein